MMEPKIRFKGFDSRLDKSLIGDFCHISTGKSNTQDKKDDGIYPFYVRSPHIERSNKYLYDEEAVLTVGDGVGTGKVFHYVNGKYDLHQRVYRMFNFKDINAKYFYYLFSQKFYKRVMSMTAKSSVDSVRLEMISKMEIEYPSINEQETIANYFTSLDSQISASTSRLASLKQMKAASLQAIFPQEGETVPKIRFKGFEGEWKKVKLGDIAKFTKGQGYSKSDLKETGQPIILYGRMYTKYQFVIDEVDTFANLKDASILSEGDEIIMPASGETPEDIACASAVLAKDIILGGDLNIMHFDLTKISTPYIALVITYSKTHHDLSKCAQGKSVVHLHNGAISRATISLPSLAEQQAIASYFTSLDRQISLQSQRLKKLKQIKSACLDKMFV